MNFLETSKILSRRRGWALGAAALALSCTLAAQPPQNQSVEAQREAMQKLAFLVGHWSGPVTVYRGAPLKLTQTEDVEWKLGGPVLLIEGRSAGEDGKTQFEALATVAYDEATHTYRFRAYNDGHYVDTELNVVPGGFSWGFAAGPAQVENTMHLTAKGEWQEETAVKFGNGPARTSVEMVLKRER